MKLCSAYAALQKMQLENGTASVKTSGNRKVLVLDNVRKNSSRQVQKKLDVDACRISWLVLSLLEWLPAEKIRFVWVENLNFGYPSTLKFLIKTSGAGQQITDESVFVFENIAQDLADQVSPNIAGSETELFVAVVIACIVDNLDFKVMSKGSTDSFYIFENIIVMSTQSQKKYVEALELCDSYHLT